MAVKKSKTALKKPAAKRKVSVVMKEFEDKKLKSSSGKKVSNPKQAIAIALSEAQRAVEKASPKKSTSRDSNKVKTKKVMKKKSGKAVKSKKK